ncbi:hypothetical protein NQX30_04595 [Candidatus Persebacteraceae bacterium Df01]|jgi:hypothetical protein|uniref:Uncharacterized protein n=1 Tax=Candidatus Doriopsillibacter californiensis TaxID=2970740 RepID=A0ABT7QMA9_9GAMM|nr:hypothetical protein [Candidatus Persebacteraceae bacterium Df01]
MAGKSLSDSEVSMIKGILKNKPKVTNQEICRMLSFPKRILNQGRISEIRTEKKHANIKPCSKEDVDKFMSGKIKSSDLMYKQLCLGIIPNWCQYLVLII